MNYEEIVCDANNLYRAYKVSVKSSKWKESTQKFMMNFLRYIFEIQDDLINRHFKMDQHKNSSCTKEAG